ncbi:hypothetical protein Pan241w_22580 [Gimesia alba]|uniref:YokE-like PH domain-containing protein n=1 Tax=Gimesia alba TaxID=2527973 RepID=A0A517RE71_9PLAN|nr:hypothetical protein [Gimesia alba]QDT42177.1 hypothetical protein Pan241w_22580 [Gimesia alba]
MQTVTPERVAAKLAELKLELSPAISYRLETLFPSLEGWFVNRKLRKKFWQIQKLEPLLTELLLEHEEVQLVLHGNEGRLTDILLTGSIWIGTTSFTALVFTNLRVLSIRTDGEDTPQKTFWSIYYSQIQSLKLTIFESARFSLKDGRILLFSAISKEELDRMQETVQENCDQFRNQGFDPAVTQSREQLCGHCFDVIPAGVYDCESCGATYWTPAEVGIRSFLFPSWGDFVMKHDALAVMELIGFCLLLIFTLAAFSEGKYVTGMAVFFMASLADAMMSVQIATKALHIKTAPHAGSETQQSFDWEEVQSVQSDFRSDYADYRVAASTDQL